jgi:hypothetical protein
MKSSGKPFFDVIYRQDEGEQWLLRSERWSDLVSFLKPLKDPGRKVYWFHSRRLKSDVDLPGENGRATFLYDCAECGEHVICRHESRCRPKDQRFFIIRCQCTAIVVPLWFDYLLESIRNKTVLWEKDGWPEAIHVCRVILDGGKSPFPSKKEQIGTRWWEVGQ